MLFIGYPKCSTSNKAKKWLEDRGIEFIERHIVEDNPKYDELTMLIKKYNLNISKLFNTNGMKYRELNLKDKLPKMSDDEKIKLLATDGMLVKRPLVILDDKVLIGFKEKEWAEYFN